MNTTQIAILAFIAAVALGPLYTVEGYSPVANVISELAAQNTARNYIMSMAFVALGAAIVYDGTKAFNHSHLPFMGFGVAFAGAGLFGHKPISAAASYSVWVDTTHSILATMSGVALTLGFIWQAASPGASAPRVLSACLAVGCVVLPLLMLRCPEFQGLTQRCMYLLVFAWLWVYYPHQIHG